jgi:hypothetical protein
MCALVEPVSLQTERAQRSKKMFVCPEKGAQKLFSYLETTGYGGNINLEKNLSSSQLYVG